LVEYITANSSQQKTEKSPCQGRRYRPPILKPSIKVQIKASHLFPTAKLGRTLVRTIPSAFDLNALVRLFTANLGLVRFKYKNQYWTYITVPQKYAFDYRE
jgi:hypothetical protein